MKFLTQFFGVFFVSTSLTFAAEPAADKPNAEPNAQTSEKPTPKGQIIPAPYPTAKRDDSDKGLIVPDEAEQVKPDGAGKSSFFKIPRLSEYFWLNPT